MWNLNVKMRAEDETYFLSFYCTYVEFKLLPNFEPGQLLVLFIAPMWNLNSAEVEIAYLDGFFLLHLCGI